MECGSLGARSLFYSGFTMLLMYYLDESGNRVYTLKHVSPTGKPTLSAHPSRFSPDDRFSRYRILVKRRFNLLPTQQPKEAC
ncbi:hypothetical protein HPB47_015941 [Ixodes persulcatus]|uniref:Uncharacterized protein n=1 Tax=Ixodes persulcatus TaxID=34615 RepID=A0AC60QSB7_IXOPE|nr:hypothetical protein HPB47_015941 [Ixodes persulcatus]